MTLSQNSQVLAETGCKIGASVLARGLISENSAACDYGAGRFEAPGSGNICTEM
jgi:hypothetical protein